MSVALDFDSYAYRKELEREKNRGIPVSPKSREAARISAGDAYSLCFFLVDNGCPLRFDAEKYGPDCWRLFGPVEGLSVYANLLEAAGLTGGSDVISRKADADSPSFDRERTSTDLYLIDLCDEVRDRKDLLYVPDDPADEDDDATGWQPSEALAAELERLMDEAEQFRAKELADEIAAEEAECARRDVEGDAAGSIISLADYKKTSPNYMPTQSNVPMSIPAQPQKLILSDLEFTAGFVPPEYLLYGILQRRFCYALTAQTGAGKTALALRLSAHVGLGRNLGDREVQKGNVLYFASENHVDVQARWIAMEQHMGFEIGKTNVQFVSGATRLSEIAEQITREAEANGRDLALVVVDTSAATFEGEDENSNVHAIEHAKRMRSLTLLRGGPTVLVLCHPTKRAAADDLIPRGGGSFLAEIDGNLCARKSDSVVEMHWAGKFRGMDFAPVMFELQTVTAQRLKDGRGRDIPTVLAMPLDEAGRQAMVATGRKDEDAVLRAIDTHPGASSAEIAKALNWFMRDRRPYGVKVRRAADKLAADGLIHKHRDTWMLTPKGQKELNSMDRRTYPLTPSPETNTQNMPVPPMPIVPPRKDH